MDDDFGVAGRLEDGSSAHQLVAQGSGVRDIAVMGNGKPATCEIRIERLHVPQARATGGGVPNVPGGHHAGKFGDGILSGEILDDVTKPATHEEIGAVIADDTGGFLSAMLKRMQSERRRRSRIGGVHCAEHAALFAQLVAVRIMEGVGNVHEACPRLDPDGVPMAMLRPDYKASAIDDISGSRFHCTASFAC